MVKFDTYKELKTHLGRDPVISAFVVITKERNGKVKKRIILNLKRSKVSSSSVSSERVLLPRTLDNTWDLMDLMAERKKKGGDIDIIIIDFKDAFWHLPVMEDEEPFLVGKCRGCYFLFKRAAQGSRGAPLIWGRLVALLNRLTAQVHDVDSYRASIYVDDQL